jgi:hypothetical protein
VGNPSSSSAAAGAAGRHQEGCSECDKDVQRHPYSWYTCRAGDLDGKAHTYDEHEDSVYGLAWSMADPWLCASLSYDGRVVVNRCESHTESYTCNIPGCCPGVGLSQLCCCTSLMHKDGVCWCGQLHFQLPADNVQMSTHTLALPVAVCASAFWHSASCMPALMLPPVEAVIVLVTAACCCAGCPRTSSTRSCCEPAGMNSQGQHCDWHVGEP